MAATQDGGRRMGPGPHRRPRVRWSDSEALLVLREGCPARARGTPAIWLRLAP